MPNQSLLRSLDFTRSSGNRRAPSDASFNDASERGGFPFEQRIQRITKIELFASSDTDPAAVIVGLKVTYVVQGVANPVVVDHGIVANVPSVGAVDLNSNEVLVGVSGRLKNLPAEPNRNRRIAFIVFSVFSRTSGLTRTQGPIGSDRNVGESWASFGPIIALQGTETTELGLTSLGFAKLTQGVPGFGVLGNGN